VDKLMRFLKDEEGASMVEYGLLVALIAIIAMVALGPLGETIRGLFEDVESEISDLTNSTE